MLWWEIISMLIIGYNVRTKKQNVGTQKSKMLGLKKDWPPYT